MSAPLGPRPIGDPDGMRRYARALRSSADYVATTADAANTSLLSATFEGPAGDRARERSERMRTRSHTRRDALALLADVVERAATEVQRAQHEWDRQHAILAERREHQARIPR